MYEWMTSVVTFKTATMSAHVTWTWRNCADLPDEGVHAMNLGCLLQHIQRCWHRFIFVLKVSQLVPKFEATLKTKYFLTHTSLCQQFMYQQWEAQKKKHLHKISKLIPPLSPLYTHCRFIKSVSYKMLQMDETASNWTLISMTNVSLQIICMNFVIWIQTALTAA